MLVEEVHALLLTGGSAFGLAAAEGVVRYLEEHGVGFDTGVARVPIVPAAVLFDLAVGDATARPGPDAGYFACTQAAEVVEQGNVGAGTGATVGPARLKGGLGTASAAEGDLLVGALVAVNAYGMVLDERGEPFLPLEEEPQPPFPGMNTVIGVVATNAELSKERVHLLALAGHDGIAAAVRPAHTIFDGDTVFSLATGTGGTDASQRVLEDLVERSMAEAIRSAMRHASSIAGIPSIHDLGEGE
jgi:L-aminopeptidase/D-esterase-like protein